MTNNFNNLNSSELTAPAFLSDLKTKVKEIVFSYDDKEALELSRQLQKVLQRTDLGLSNAHNDEFKFYYALMSYLSLPAQNDHDLFNLFQNLLLPILTLDEQAITSRLETKFWLVPYGAREEFAEKLIAVIRQNREQLAKLTLGEWLATYIHQYQKAIELGDLEISDFITKNENAKILKLEEQITLSKLFRIYNYLRPLELNAPYARQILKESAEGGGASDGLDAKQKRLGDALARNMPRASVVNPNQITNTSDIRNPSIQSMPPRSQNLSNGYSERISPNTQPPYPQKPPYAFSPNQAKIKRENQTPAASESEMVNSDFQKNSSDVVNPVRELSVSLLNKNIVHPVRGLPSNGIQRKYPPKADQPWADPPRPLEIKNKNTENSNTLTIEKLEQIAASEDAIAEEKARQTIRQDFNQLSNEVRNYIMNSPFWN